MMGVGRYLKHNLTDVRTVAVQPDGPMHGLEGLKHIPTSDVPQIYDQTVLDEIVDVSTEEAYRMARDLAHYEGLFVGISAAAAAVAALSIASRLEWGVIVAIFPDSGLKYIDQPFWSAP
jgi:cysteine synthase B